MPVGQWNTSRIVFRGNHGEHWLNGEKSSTSTRHPAHGLGARRRASTARFPASPTAVPGHIILQDHGDAIYFRSLKIRPLD